MSDVNLDERGPLDILGVAIGNYTYNYRWYFFYNYCFRSYFINSLNTNKNGKGLSAAIKTKGFGTGELYIYSLRNSRNRYFLQCSS